MSRSAVRSITIGTLLTASILLFAFMPSNFTYADTGVSCDTWYGSVWNFSACTGRSIAVWIGTVLIWITGYFLGIAGALFNWLIENTVVNFDSAIYGTVSSGIQAAWTAFRDLANIVIIGIFTFVAIEMILGTQTFGGRRTVAKVLIIAILINFSLLFARIVVETSNFMARQFYQAVQLRGDATTASNSTLSNQYSAGVSGRFAKMMGVTGFVETKDALYKSAEDKKNGFIALGQGVLTAILFVAASAVFLYAAFLMVARAILLIFLIMTSSLAFASWLLPSSFTGSYGFAGWWSALIKNAIFGPLLIIMLWATIKVGEELSKIPGSGQIGGLINNPADAGGVGALFGYLIILGMLFVSVRVASSFASKISGFDYAAIVPALGAGALARTVSFAGRNTLGRTFSAAANVTQNASRNTNLGIGTRNALDRVAQNLRKGATADYDPLKAKMFGQSLGAEMQKTVGFRNRKMLANKSLGGYDGVAKKRAEAIAERTERITPKNLTDAEKAAVREQTSKEQPELASSQASTSKELHEATIRLADMQKQHAEATQAFTAKIDEMTNHMEKMKSEVLVAGDNPQTDPKIRELQQSIEREKSQHKAEMKSQEDRIEHAREMMKKAKESHQTEENAFDEVLNEKIADRLSRGEVVAKNAQNRFTNALEQHVAGFSKQENEALAKGLRQRKATQEAIDALKAPMDKKTYEQLSKEQRRTQQVDGIMHKALNDAGNRGSAQPDTPNA